MSLSSIISDSTVFEATREMKPRCKHSCILDRKKLSYLKDERYIIAAIIAGAVWGYAEIAHYVS